MNPWLNFVFAPRKGPCSGVIVFSVVPVKISASKSRIAPALTLLSLFLPATTLAQQTIGELYATDASVKGSVILAGSGTSVLSGSQIAAGARTATLQLERGGNVLICPGTGLSASSSQNGRQLLFSLNSGNLVLDYPIGSASDSLLTPDFRLLLPGPGKIHVAVSVQPNGDTCVQSLPMNESAVVVAEAMGDESYQVKQNEAVIFKGGHIQGASATHKSCGCALPPQTQVAHAVPPPAPAPKPSPTSGAALAAALDAASIPKSAVVSNASSAADPPPPNIADAHLLVEAPFVFRGDSTPPALTEIVSHLKVVTEPQLALTPVVLPPRKQQKQAQAKEQTIAANPSAQRGSFFSKIGAFFASIFH